MAVREDHRGAEIRVHRGDALVKGLLAGREARAVNPRSLMKQCHSGSLSSVYRDLGMPMVTAARAATRAGTPRRRGRREARRRIPGTAVQRRDILLEGTAGRRLSCPRIPDRISCPTPCACPSARPR